MYFGPLEVSRVIEAFRLHVPDTYVRDYSANRGFLVICKGYKDIPWRDQLSTRKVYRQVPNVTLVNLPTDGAFVGPATRFAGLALQRPGWRLQFRRAMRYLSYHQMKGITRTLGAGEVFPGIV